MSNRTTDSLPDDDDPRLRDFEAALKAITGPRHPIYLVVGPRRRSMAACLHPAAVAGMLEQALRALPDPAQITAAPLLPHPTRWKPAQLADWVDSTFNLNAAGVLHRLRQHDQQLHEAVDLTVHGLLGEVVDWEYRRWPEDVRDDVLQQLYTGHLLRWLKTFNPTTASLKTYLSRQAQWKTLSRRERISLGLETEPPVPGSNYEGADGTDDLLEAALEELSEHPEMNDEIIRDRFVRDLSTAEIAAKHGKSPGAIRASISRKLASMRRHLGIDTPPP